MTTIEQPGNGLPDNLPVLTQVATRELPDDLPVLTEIIKETQHAAPPSSLSEAGMRQLQQRLEAYLETVFTQKLAILQQQAAEQILAELKSALPELLRDALNTTNY